MEILHKTSAFILVSIVFVLQSCSSDLELHKVMDEYGNLIEEYYRKKENYAKEGLYKAYYEGSTALMETANYKDDKMDGEYIRFYENGDTMSIAMMKDGVYEGYFKEYYPNNKIKQFYFHKGGKISGQFREYYDNGTLKGDILFEDNDENGAFTEYHENGKIAVKGTYKNGLETGELLKYDENGVLEKTMNCEIVKTKTAKNKNGNSKTIIHSLCKTVEK